MGQRLTYDAFINLLNSIGFAGDAVDQHGGSILWSVPAALLLLAGVALKPKWRPPLPDLTFAAAPVMGVALLSLLLFARGGEGSRGLPGASTPLRSSSPNLHDTVTGEPGQRPDARPIPGKLQPPPDAVAHLPQTL